MRHGQIITYGIEGKPLAQVQGLADRHHAGLRATKQAEGCLSWLQKEGASLVILKTGRDLEAELGLLADISSYYPDTPTFLLGDVEHMALADMAWDLGAACVFMPLASFEHLREAAERFLSPIGQSESFH